MTILTAAKSFLPFGVDFTQILELKSDFLFKDNVGAVIDGITYQDIAAYQFGEVNVGTAYFRGSRLAVSSADALTAGTVTSFGFYTGTIGDLSSPDWTVRGIKVSATEIAAIMASPDRDDDSAFFSSLFTGNDRITLSPEDDYFEGLGGNDVIYGNGGGDALFGGDGNDRLYGGGGDDDLYGGLGDDVLVGGAGIDSVSYDEITTSVTVNLTITTQQNTGGGGLDTIKGVERLYGGMAGDTLTGSLGDNGILGMDGDDVINGLAGNDRIYGGLGKDTLTGGAGKDRFVFNTDPSTANADTITDFDRTLGDRIVLTPFSFAALSGRAGSGILKGEFYAAAGATSAHDADDHIIYNTTTGRLYYDEDGLGGASGILIATLGTTTHPTLVFSDILLGF